MKRSLVAFCGVVGALGTIGSSLGGCSGSLSSKADGGGAGACADYITKYCDRLAACEPGVLALFGFASVSDCVTYDLPWCTDSLAAPLTGQTPALVQQCGDGIAAMSCTDFLQGKTVPACLPRGGGVPSGGPCSSEWQCASGRCLVQTFGACGTCVPVVPAGQTCNGGGFLGSDCADNLVCAVAIPDGPVVCTPSVALGAACAETSVCPSNASCDLTTHVCTQSPSIGQACDPSATIYCDPTKAAALCDPATSLCVPVSVAQAGQACDMVNGAYAQCNGSCDQEGDGGAAVCHPFVTEGQACTAYDLCALGTACSDGVCTALVCDGAASDAAVAAAAATAGASDGRRAIPPARRPMARRP